MVTISDGTTLVTSVHDNTLLTSDVSPGQTNTFVLDLSPEVFSNIELDTNNYHPNPTIQFFLETDINLDKLSDIIVHLWWDVNSSGEVVIEDPTPDLLLAYVQNSDGTFKLSNEEVFGSSLPQLGGASRKVSAKDINGDGVTDFAFAMNFEDQRAQVGVSETNAAQPSLILSNNKGGYDVVRMGEKSWGHGVEIIQLSETTFDVAFGGFTDPVVQVFRYDNNDFIDVASTYQSLPHVGSWANTVNSHYDSSGKFSYVGASLGDTVYNDDGSKTIKNGFVVNQISLTEQTELFSWFIEPDFLMASENDPLNAGIHVFSSIWGTPVAHAAIDAQRFYKEASGRLILTNKFSGARIDETLTLEDGGILPEDSLTPFSTFEFFTIDGAEVTRIGNIVGEISNVNTNFFDVMDINGDGFFDLAVHAFNRPWENTQDTNNLPIIYINDGNDNLVLTSVDTLFSVSEFEQGVMINGSQTVLIDLNQDGLPELAQIPETLRDDFTVNFSSLISNAIVGVKSIGDASDDVMDGTDGNDTIASKAGDDSISAGAGNDRIAASDGNDTVDGGSGDDMIGGGLGNDSISGGTGHDTIGSGDGNDTVDGGDGDDMVAAGRGDDTVSGGIGDDRLAGSVGEDSINGDEGEDNIGGGYNDDTIHGGTGNDTVGAGQQDDLLYGDEGDDVLNGNWGHDTIFGGDGNDTIAGGDHNDVMTGGNGADVFKFRVFNTDTEDRITDFTRGEDLLEMRGSFAGLNISNHADGLQVEKNGHVIILEDVTDLSADDFNFV